jgi:hypothetical protein
MLGTLFPDDEISDVFQKLKLGDGARLIGRRGRSRLDEWSDAG